MSAADDELRDANWKRMRQALSRAAVEYRRIADELDAIRFDSTAGIRRAPEAIISQAALTADPGRVHADLMHRLATWSESINEIERHAVVTASCPAVSTDGKGLVCVLGSGHDGDLRWGHEHTDGTRWAINSDGETVFA